MQLRPGASTESDLPQGRSAGMRAGWTMLVLLTLGYVLAMVDRSILVVLIGPLQRDLHLSDTQFGLLQGLAFALFYVLAGLPIGFLIDRMRRVLIITLGLLVWSVATMLSALAGTFAMLFLARTVVAVGEATLNPATYSLLSDVFPRHGLGRAIGIFSTGATVGTGTAYLLGGILLNGSTAAGASIPLLGSLHVWQLAFLVAGFPGVILAIVIACQREPAREPLQVADSTSHPWGDFFRSRHRPLLLMYGASCCQTLLFYAFLTWSPALLIREHGLSGGDAGLLLGCLNLVFGIAGFVAGGWVADRWFRTGRHDAHMRVGFLAHCVIFPFALLAALAGPLALVIPALCIVNFMQLATGPATIAALQLVTPAPFRGRASAILMMATAIAGVGLGPTVVAILNDAVFGSRAAVGQSLACIVAVVTPLALLLFHHARASVAAAIDARADRAVHYASIEESG